MQAYSDSSRESDPHALPDIEVFELTAAEIVEMDEDMLYEYASLHEYRLAFMSSRVREQMIDSIIAQQGITGGWYWQACFPGCLPDSDPVGPFATRADALKDAQELHQRFPR